jgi:hypothetical protein
MLLGITACQPPMIPPPVEPIVQSISAMGKVSTYKLETKVINDFRVVSGPADKPGTTPERPSTIWNGSRSVDLSRNRLHLSMNIETGATPFIFERYLIGGDDYLRQTSPAPYRNGTPDISWQKNSNSSLWNTETQIPQLIELMQTAVKTSLAGGDIVDGEDCFVIDITASNEAIADWVVSQDQWNGPSLTISHGGPTLIGKENYTRFNKGSSVMLWIAKDNFLILKAVITANFSATTAQLGMNAGPDGPNTITSRFQGYFNFSEYNQPLDIQPPVINNGNG